MTASHSATLDPEIRPRDVHLVKVLGKGRAATARLVDVTLEDGSALRVVEKVFRPGWLTRIIYRSAFWAPFAYRDNRDAILTAFYRRRIAAEILRRSGLPVDVAMPTSVRFDHDAGAWVLAAQHIVGHGICPAPPRVGDITDGERDVSQIRQRVDVMRSAGRFLHHAGLVGSVWQIDPSAMVSTANMLRVGERHVIVDLESGIPSILLPKYILQSIRAKSFPPFDDLDEGMLTTWVQTNDVSQEVIDDAAKLIHHNSAWKSSEPTPLRVCSRVSITERIKRFSDQAIDRMRRRDVIGSTSVGRWAIFAAWCLSCIPFIGERLAALIANPTTRTIWIERIADAECRRDWLDQRWRRTTEKLILQNRLPADAEPGRVITLLADVLSKATSPPMQRFAFDRSVRRRRLRGLMRLLTSPRYQRLAGTRWMRKSIRHWHEAERLTAFEAATLRRDAGDPAIAVYARGLSFHAALKLLTPVVAPLKFGGLVWFFFSGNVLHLLPLVALPAARTLVTCVIGMTRKRGEAKATPLGHALWVGLLPTIGTSAFTVQLAASKPALSQFLIRDAASKIGRHLPVYGGADSRTEMAMIAACDPILTMLHRWIASPPSVELHATEARPANQQQSRQLTRRAA